MASVKAGICVTPMKFTLWVDFLLFRCRQRPLNGKTNFAFFIDGQDLYIDLILDFKEIMDIFYILIGHFGNMYKPYFLSGSSTKAPKGVIPVTIPSKTLPTSIAMLVNYPPFKVSVYKNELP